MTPGAWFGVALLVHAGWAAAVAAAGARGPRLGALALLALAPLELALPTLVPLGHPGSGLLRILLAIHCGVSWIKACELHLARRRRGYPSGWSAWTWLLWVRPANHLYSRRGNAGRAPGIGAPRPPRACLRGLALGVALLALGLPALIGVFRADLGRFGFWPDHLAKFAAAYTVLIGLERVGTSLVNLLGIPAQPVLRDPACAYSPADFWQRWNQPVNQLLWAVVFRRWARRAPLGGLLLTFLLSGLFHEYTAAIASLHLRGYQLAFFLLHGLAAALTWRWRPRGAARAVGHVGTVAFGLATSPLFFASLVPVFADLVAFYPHGPLLPP